MTIEINSQQIETLDLKINSRYANIIGTWAVVLIRMSIDEVFDKTSLLYPGIQGRHVLQMGKYSAWLVNF